MGNIERSIDINNVNTEALIFGKLDENVKLIEESFNVKLRDRGGKIVIFGAQENVEETQLLIYNLAEILKKQSSISLADVRYSIELVKKNESRSMSELLNDILVYTSMGKPIKRERWEISELQAFIRRTT